MQPQGPDTSANAQSLMNGPKMGRDMNRNAMSKPTSAKSGMKMASNKGLKKFKKSKPMSKSASGSY